MIRANDAQRPANGCADSNGALVSAARQRVSSVPTLGDLPWGCRLVRSSRASRGLLLVTFSSSVRVLLRDLVRPSTGLGRVLLGELMASATSSGRELLDELMASATGSGRELLSGRMTPGTGSARILLGDVLNPWRGSECVGRRTHLRILMSPSASASRMLPGQWTDFGRMLLAGLPDT
jgi:hypothetical protein